MTLEEAIKELQKGMPTFDSTDEECERYVEAYNMAIKALEQERSRSAEITQYRYDCEKLMEENERLKKALEQEPKTGHWIDTDDGFSPCECSECEAVEFKKSKDCPNCGAKMEGESK